MASPSSTAYRCSQKHTNDAGDHILYIVSENLQSTSEWCRTPSWLLYSPTRCSHKPNTLLSALSEICVSLSRYGHTSHLQDLSSQLVFVHSSPWLCKLYQLVSLGILLVSYLYASRDPVEDQVCFLHTCRSCHGACFGFTGCSAIEIGGNNVSCAASSVLTSPSATIARAPGPLKSSDPGYTP
jgi:hypothetical protein